MYARHTQIHAKLKTCVINIRAAEKEGSGGEGGGECMGMVGGGQVLESPAE